MYSVRGAHRNVTWSVQRLWRDVERVLNERVVLNLWQIGLAAIFIGFLFYQVKQTASLGAKNRGFNPPNDVYSSYKEDEIEGINWRWTYSKAGQNENLTPYCKDCDMKIVGKCSLTRSGARRSRKWRYRCENCNAAELPIKLSMTSLKKRVERHLDRKIRTGEWAL